MIDRRFSKPFVTPSTMLATSERDRPWRLRLKPSSSGRSTRAAPSAMTTRMFGWIVCVRLPRGPCTVTTLPSSTLTCTPLGSSMGCLPIRLIVCSPHVGEDLPADSLFGRRPVGHDALGRRDDRDPQPAHDAGQIAAAAVAPPSRLGDAPQPRDRARLARAVLHLDAER